MIAYVPFVIDIHERIWPIVNRQPEDGDIIRVDNAMHAVNQLALTRSGHALPTYKP